jgi:type II secretory pathway pseudopilin PulG
MKRTRSGFVLLEVVVAVAIFATAILGLMATVSGARLSVGDTLNRRKARTLTQAKVEEIIAGITEPDGGGSFDDEPAFSWSASSEELSVGVGETQTEKVLVVTVTLSFPLDSGDGADGSLTATTIVAIAEEEE